MRNLAEGERFELSVPVARTRRFSKPLVLPIHPTFQKMMVRPTGLEPARLATLEPKSSASANFATDAIQHLAEKEGFEPPCPCGLIAFQARQFNQAPALLQMAEEEGFEPSVGLTLRRFSKPLV